MRRGVPTSIKWVCGNKQLFNQFEKFFPNKIERCFEPFVSGRTIAFHILKNYNSKEVILSDINKDLINTYKAVKYNFEELITKIDNNQKKNVTLYLNSVFYDRYIRYCKKEGFFFFQGK